MIDVEISMVWPRKEQFSEIFFRGHLRLMHFNRNETGHEFFYQVFSKTVVDDFLFVFVIVRSVKLTQV